MKCDKCQSDMVLKIIHSLEGDKAVDYCKVCQKVALRANNKDDNAKATSNNDISKDLRNVFERILKDKPKE